MPAEFVVVGGAVTGLAVAIALSRVGHKVTVLEQMASFDEVRALDWAVGAVRGCGV